MEASEIEALVLPERVDVGIGSLEVPSGPEKAGLPPLEIEGVVLERR